MHKYTITFGTIGLVIFNSLVWPYLSVIFSIKQRDVTSDCLGV